MRAAHTAGRPRILAIMGSGETAPTMTSVHADLIDRLGSPPVPAVLLDTPFGFQENADDICAKTMAYFRKNVGREIGVASCRDTAAASALEYETFLIRIAEALYVFAGPGSPTYALRQWRETDVPALLAEKLQKGGCVTFASAAAVGLGAVALPVYEVYKVGEPAHWVPGLDLLATIGIHAALIPHYNNAEGGTHDTRYCYMGERRLRLLEEQLPEETGILGVDEHTACIIDVERAAAEVRGRGGVTVRWKGCERRYPSGETIPLGALDPAAAFTGSNAGASHAVVAAGAVSEPGTAVAAPEAAVAGSSANGSSPLLETVEEHCRVAEAGFAARDPQQAVDAVLGLESQLNEWAHDTLDSDQHDRGRTTLRRLIVRLGEVAREGAVDSRERVAPFVDAILRERRRAREERRWAEADRLRDLLIECGVEVRDTKDGTDWVLGSAA